jgi:glutathione synthase/RimK-type ligase-like ATP-grasp enzyme
MPDVRLVTCASPAAPDPDTPAVAEALAARGVVTVVDDWRDRRVDWSDARVTLVRSPWDYIHHLDEFLAWADHVATVSALWNPPDLIRWNTHKAYLLELQRRGAPIVPTVVLAAGGAASLDGIADAQGWNEVVVKPAVSVGAIGAGRFEVGDPAGQAHLDDLLERGDALVQLFAPAVTDDGEISVIVVGGRVTHAVRKRPAPGDYRIHPQYGGHVEATTPTVPLAELAERVCATVPSPPLYARVDVLALGGLWHVIECEVTEPRLFLEHGAPHAMDALVDAVVTRLGAATP